MMLSDKTDRIFTQTGTVQSTLAQHSSEFWDRFSSDALEVVLIPPLKKRILFTVSGEILRFRTSQGTLNAKGNKTTSNQSGALFIVSHR